MKLYGRCPDREVFSVVTCYECGLVLKPQALKHHIKKRHNGNDLVLYEEAIPTIKVEPMTNSNPNEIQQKIAINLNIESYPLIFSPLLIFKKDENLQSKSFEVPQSSQPAEDPKIESDQCLSSFTLPKPLKRRIAHRQNESNPLKLKMKIRKVEQGKWSVVNV